MAAARASGLARFQSMNLHEEYRKACRTSSYVELWMKAHCHIKQQPLDSGSKSVGDALEALSKIFSVPNKKHLVKFLSLKDDSTRSDSASSRTPDSDKIDIIAANLLDPDQAEVDAVLRDMDNVWATPASFFKLVLDYFDNSLKASDLCGELLKSVAQARENNRIVESAMSIMHSESSLDPVDTSQAADTSNSDADDSIFLSEDSSSSGSPRSSSSSKAADGCHPIHIADELSSADYSHSRHKRSYMLRSVHQELHSYVEAENPFSDMEQFQPVLGGFADMQCRLDRKKRKLDTRMRICKGMVNICSVVLVTTCQAVGVLRTTKDEKGRTDSVGSPIKGCLQRCFYNSNMKAFKVQLDAASKGTYVVTQDLDTIKRLVARLRNEVEHTKGRIRFWNRQRDDQNPVNVMVDHLTKNQVVCSQQLDDLEQHIYLCFMTVNKARTLMVQKIVSKVAP